MALADKTRLRLLNLIRDEEVCVCFFVEALKESQPKISRHLAYLRKTGLVSARKEGKWVHYKIVQPESIHMRGILFETLEHLKAQPQMKTDRERMVKACLSIEAPIAISKTHGSDTLAKTDMSPRNPAEPEELETFLL